MNEKNYHQNEATKRYLRRYKKTKLIIDHYEEKLAKLDDRLYHIKSPNMSGEVRGGTPISQTELISDKMELLNSINKLVERAREYKSDIRKCLDQLDDVKEIQVLELFFIDCKDFEDIADETGYSLRHVIRLYCKAISKIDVTLESQ